MTQPVRLGLPWQLNHYKPLNGAHPLVLSFLEGNGAVDAAQAKDAVVQECVVVGAEIAAGDGFLVPRAAVCSTLRAEWAAPKSMIFTSPA